MGIYSQNLAPMLWEASSRERRPFPSLVWLIGTLVVWWPRTRACARGSERSGFEIPYGLRKLSRIEADVLIWAFSLPIRFFKRSMDGSKKNPLMPDSLRVQKHPRWFYSSLPWEPCTTEILSAWRKCPRQAFLDRRRWKPDFASRLRCFLRRLEDE